MHSPRTVPASCGLHSLCCGCCVLRRTRQGTANENCGLQVTIPEQRCTWNLKGRLCAGGATFPVFCAACRSAIVAVKAAPWCLWVAPLFAARLLQLDAC